MQLMGTRVLLTGAAGGIGRCTALELARRGCALALLDRDAEGLRETVDLAREAGAHAASLVADLSELEEIPGLVDQAVLALGGLDLLINNAGVIRFSPFEQEDVAGLDRMLRVNVTAPMALTRAALGTMLARGSGRVVNVGSIFGSIGFAYFAGYSATKSAVRGFSEALRRELDGTGVGVTYVAPRATRTGLASVFGRMAEETGMTLDDPEVVARRIVDAVERDAKDAYLGFPESLFVRINALLPRLIDRATRKQNARTRSFAVEACRVARSAAPEAAIDVSETRAAFDVGGASGGGGGVDAALTASSSPREPRSGTSAERLSVHP